MRDGEEGRAVGVMAQYVASHGDYIREGIKTALGGGPLAPITQGAANAEPARSHAGVTKDEVLRILRASKGRIANAVRSIPDDQLDIEGSTPAGPRSAAGRVERGLIGNLKQHQRPMEAGIA